MSNHTNCTQAKVFVFVCLLRLRAATDLDEIWEPGLIQRLKEEKNLWFLHMVTNLFYIYQPFIFSHSI